MTKSSSKPNHLSLINLIRVCSHQVIPIFSADSNHSSLVQTYRVCHPRVADAKCNCLRSSWRISSIIIDGKTVLSAEFLSITAILFLQVPILVTFLVNADHHIALSFKRGRLLACLDCELVDA